MGEGGLTLEIWKGVPSPSMHLSYVPSFQFYCFFMLNVSKKFVNFYQPHDGLWTVSVDESRVELRDSPKLQYVGIPGKKHQFFNWKLKNVVKFLKINWLYYMVFNLPINILCLFSKYFTQKKNYQQLYIIDFFKGC